MNGPMKGSRATVLPAGDGALLVEPHHPHALASLVDELATTRPAGVAETVVGARTVLLLLDPGADADAVAQSMLERLEHPVADSARPTGPEIIIPVRYDGPDLADVAEELCVSPEAVVARHLEALWRCDFIGFAPGFGYLSALDGRLSVARLAEPRARIPAGSVGLADGYSAIYPRESPGGWRLIGRTDAVLWDLGRTHPNLIAPGTRVRFVAGNAG